MIFFDIFISEQEVSCLATWSEGSSRYLVGHLLEPPSTRNSRHRPQRGQRLGSVSTETEANGASIRCFRYEKRYESGKLVLRMSQSFTSSCKGMWSVDEGQRTFKMSKGKVSIFSPF
jgi:hypothetical protein